ncbi:MAG: MFS transporter [Chloroflexota bacterium]|nr:MAG: MFS transporter [Chloroflexota bacterium]
MKTLTDVQKNPRRFHIPVSFPWAIVLLGTMLLLIRDSNPNTFVVIFKPISEEFGWSRAAVSGAIALRSLVTGCLALVMGYFADQYGPRRVLLPSFLLAGVGFLMYGSITSMWQLYLVQGLIMGIAMSSSYVVVMSTVAKWHKKPGLALGIAAAGIGLSSIVFPPLATTLLESMSWREVSIVLGMITFVVAVPMSIVMIDPTSMKEQRIAKPDEHRNPFAFWGKLPGLLRNRILLAIVLAFFLMYAAGIMLSIHLINYITDIGASPLLAAAMMSVMGIASVIGRLGMGAISDKIGTRADTAVCCTSVALSLILLMMKIPALMWIAVVLFGIGFGGYSPLTPAIMAEYFGRKNLSTLTGAIATGAVFGNALGAWMGGFIFDVTNSYFWALALSAAITIVALAIVLRLPSARESRAKGLSLLE